MPLAHPPAAPRQGPSASPCPRSKCGAAVHSRGHRSPTDRGPGVPRTGSPKRGRGLPPHPLDHPQSPPRCKSPSAFLQPSRCLRQKNLFSIKATLVPESFSRYPAAPLSLPPSSLPVRLCSRRQGLHKDRGCRVWGTRGCWQRIRAHAREVSKRSRTPGSTVFRSAKQTRGTRVNTTEDTWSPPSPFSPLLVALPGEEAGGLHCGRGKGTRGHAQAVGHQRVTHLPPPQLHTP